MEENKQSLDGLSREQLIEMIGDRERRMEALKGKIEWWQEAYDKETRTHSALRKALESVLALSGDK